MDKNEILSSIDKALAGNDESLKRIWNICLKLESLAQKEGYSNSEKEFYGLGNCWLLLTESDSEVNPAYKNAVRKSIKSNTLRALSEVFGWD